VSALITGLADWTWDFSPTQLDAIIRNPQLQALRAETMRVTYLSLDAAGRTGEGMPLTNVAVRRAIDHAIDRTGIADTVVGTGSRPIFTPCFPSQFGCVESAAVRRAYSPDRARALMAQAGFPNGFTTDLISDQLPAMIEAIRRDLSAIGITTRVDAARSADAIAIASAGRAPLFLSSWGSYAINDAAAFMPPFFTGGPLDYTRDPVVSRLVDQAVSSTDPDRRRQEFADAIERITQNAFWLPIASAVRTYGFDRSLDFRAFADDLPRFYLARWR
jgi:peptide/nickel transport system substrate-binding protein